VADGTAVHALELTKRFGRTAAVRALNLDIPVGERVAIFGPNGSGKTTLLRMLAGMTRPTSGAFTLFGSAERKAPFWSRLGVVAHQTYLYSDLTAEENLLFYGRMFGLSDHQRHVNQALLRVGAEGKRRERVSTLSRGMQQRVTIARALLHDPDLLILDEPDTGLDQQASTDIAALLDLNEQRQRTLLMATHNLGLGLRLCTRYIVLTNGRLVGGGSLAGLDLVALTKAYAQATAQPA